MPAANKVVPTSPFLKVGSGKALDVHAAWKKPWQLSSMAECRWFSSTWRTDGLHRFWLKTLASWSKHPNIRVSCVGKPVTVNRLDRTWGPQTTGCRFVARWLLANMMTPLKFAMVVLYNYINIILHTWCTFAEILQDAKASGESEKDASQAKADWWLVGGMGHFWAETLGLMVEAPQYQSFMYWQTSHSEQIGQDTGPTTHGL